MITRVERATATRALSLPRRFTMRRWRSPRTVRRFSSRSRELSDLGGCSWKKVEPTEVISPIFT